jgi:hypothetical protein
MPEKGGKFNVLRVRPKIGRAELPDNRWGLSTALEMAYAEANYAGNVYVLD